MATEYGVQTANIFALLGEEGTAPAKKAAPKKTPQKKPQPQESQPKTTSTQPKQPAQTKAKPSPQEPSGGPSRSQAQKAQAAVAKEADAGPQPRGKDTKRFLEEPTGGRHKRGHGDRHSGTGRSPVENKKQGSGKGNWGKAGEEVLEPIEPLPQEEEEKESVEVEVKQPEEASKVAAPTDAGVKDKGKDTEEEDEEEKTILYDEYLKKQAEAKAATAKLTLPPPRPANEGKQDPKWATVPLLRKDEFYAADDTEKPKGTTKPKKPKPGTENKAAELLNFQDNRPRGGGRGRRGGGERRDRGERGGERREGFGRGERRDRGERGGQDRADQGDRSFGDRRPGGRGRGGDRRQNQSPKKFQPERKAPQFDEKSFPALSPSASSGGASAVPQAQPQAQAQAPPAAAPSPASPTPTSQ